MATFHKFDCVVENLAEKVHNLGSDTLKILLTNATPDAGDTVVDTTTTPCTLKAVSNGQEIAAAAGYSKGGPTVGITSSSQTSGTYALVQSANITITAGAALGPFQYAVLYNDSAGAAATRPVLGWWEYATSESLAIDENLTIAFGASILTLA